MRSQFSQMTLHFPGKNASSSSSSSSATAAAAADSANMYRVGDYVYFENSSSASYAIRRIEELNKTSTGAVEARVICFYRRQELSASLLAQVRFPPGVPF